MSSIRAIEARSIHQIQSGQVIVDLCSVVKELVENSLDAGASSVDIRFKNHGLDAIEVQDNGKGISPDDYEYIALKHYTSKLSSFDDLGTLTTFGFRGEALSSLCAVSRLHIVTARDGDAPKGKRLDFEISGKLRGTEIAACPRGTTVVVEDLFYSLPVRRRELEKNIKREYGKVLGILHAYACISTNVRLAVSNQMPKGKKVVVFATRANPSTKENIADCFGSKTLSALIPLDLNLRLEPTTGQTYQDAIKHGDEAAREVKIVGHVSKPVFGEGRQTPDRQMFFVNSRPCLLPQFAKAFNEVYRSYNVTQSPFVCANLMLDTNSYDVNVSPDKRTILLHDQAALLGNLKTALTDLFESQEQTVPQSQLMGGKLPNFRSLNLPRQVDAQSETNEEGNPTGTETEMADESMAEPSSSRDAQEASSSVFSLTQTQTQRPHGLLQNFLDQNLEERKVSVVSNGDRRTGAHKQKLSEKTLHKTVDQVQENQTRSTESSEMSGTDDEAQSRNRIVLPRAVQDFNARIASEQPKAIDSKRTSTSAVEQEPEEIGNANKRRRVERDSPVQNAGSVRPSTSQLTQKLRAFAAPGSKLPMTDVANDVVEDHEMVDSADQSEEAELETESDASEDEKADGDSATQSEHSDHNETYASTRVSRFEGAIPNPSPPDDSDGEYLDEDEKKRKEEVRIKQLIEEAEKAATKSDVQIENRAAHALTHQPRKDSTHNLVRQIETSTEDIRTKIRATERAMQTFYEAREDSSVDLDIPSSASEEERLQLTISKSDFAKMRVAGQFNLGFILATRTLLPAADSATQKPKEDLFIIDQHASDEIYNFSRLSSTTTLQPQPLVRPLILELTAIEEETIQTHHPTLLKNGFNITIDTSGASPVGRRCTLNTLPTSKETVFDTRDLEELIALLNEATPAAGEVLRPSRVRKMLAMRACRSSIMVGKPLSLKGMKGVVRHMGEIERPWNCPHGRPTMRHLVGLGEWAGWSEGTGLVEDESEGVQGKDWSAYLETVAEGMSTWQGSGEEDDDEGTEEGKEDDGDKNS